MWFKKHCGNQNYCDLSKLQWATIIGVKNTVCKETPYTQPWVTIAPFFLVLVHMTLTSLVAYIIAFEWQYSVIELHIIHNNVY